MRRLKIMTDDVPMASGDVFGMNDMYDNLQAYLALLVGVGTNQLDSMKHVDKNDPVERERQQLYKRINERFVKAFATYKLLCDDDHVLVGLSGGKVDTLEGMKENVICGHLIPAGTGLREFDKLIVGSKEEYERMQANRKNVLDFVQENVLDE